MIIVHRLRFSGVLRVYGEWATYAIVDAMNGHAWGGGLPKGVYIKEQSEIRQPGRRIVFIDEGCLSFGSDRF